ncbi:MAG: cytochrome c, partial [Fimbriiglobus sp.]
GSVLYRRSCSQCHGLTGDGRGPTGPWLYPHPRDFRQGVFKASANTPGGKPRPADLKRVIKYGVPGTSMPVFDLLPDADVDAIAAYVQHLSVRGEAEFRATAALLDDGDEGPATDPAAEVRTATDTAMSQWLAAAASAAPIPEIPADSTAESVRRGHELFLGAAGCVGCHVDYGRAEQFRYDVWGVAGRVADLTGGDRRWGKSADDLARRVKYGSPAAGMPANPLLADDQVRDLVAFLRDLPAPPRLPDDVRARVYP